MIELLLSLFSALFPPSVDQHEPSALAKDAAYSDVEWDAEP